MRTRGGGIVDDGRRVACRCAFACGRCWRLPVASTLEKAHSKGKRKRKGKRDVIKPSATRAGRNCIIASQVSSQLPSCGCRLSGGEILSEYYITSYLLVRRGHSRGMMREMRNALLLLY